MRKHFTNSLAVIFAVLGVYFVAFKVLMKVGVKHSMVKVVKPMWRTPGEPPENDPRPHGWYETAKASHVPRWEFGNDFAQRSMMAFFVPLIWMEKKVRGGDHWQWDGSGQEPVWIKELEGKP